MFRAAFIISAATFCGIHSQAGPIPPFTPDLSAAGGAVTSAMTIASGLDFPYGMAVTGDGSLLFGQTDPTSIYGVEGAPSNGSVWLIPKQPGGSFGAPQQVIGNLSGPVTNVRSTPDGLTLVDSGAASGRTMTFYNQNFQQIGAVNFTYPTDDWWHSTGMSLIEPQSDGSYRVFFIVGSEADTAKTTVPVTTSGLFTSTLNADSLYMGTIKNTGGVLQAVGAPAQVATGLRNAYGLSFDAAGDLIIGDNGQDGAHIGHELGADTLHAIPAAQIGQSIYDFGFPNSYVDFGTGSYIDGDPGATPPLAAFVPVADANGVLQYSEGLSAMGFVPFMGAQGGEFIGFHGEKNGTGAANDDNALLYYDFASGRYFPVVDAGTPGVGHLNTVLISGNTLYIADMATAGVVDGVGGADTGAIYAFTLATPEPSSIALACAGFFCIALRLRRLNCRLA